MSLFMFESEHSPSSIYNMIKVTLKYPFTDNEIITVVEAFIKPELINHFQNHTVIMLMATINEY